MKGLLFLVVGGTAVIANLHLQGVMTEIPAIDDAIGWLLAAVGFIGG